MDSSNLRMNMQDNRVESENNLLLVSNRTTLLVIFDSKLDSAREHLLYCSNYLNLQDGLLTRSRSSERNNIIYKTAPKTFFNERERRLPTFADSPLPIPQIPNQSQSLPDKLPAKRQRRLLAGHFDFSGRDAIFGYDSYFDSSGAAAEQKGDNDESLSGGDNVMSEAARQESRSLRPRQKSAHLRLSIDASFSMCEPRIWWKRMCSVVVSSPHKIYLEDGRYAVKGVWYRVGSSPLRRSYRYGKIPVLFCRQRSLLPT